MSDVLKAVRLAMGIVVHRIDAPFVPGPVMRGMYDSVHQRVAEKHVRMRHVNLCTEHFLAFCIFSVPHLTEKLKVLLYRAVPVRAFRTRYLDCTASCAYFFLGLVIDISKTFLYEFLSPFIELVKIVRGISLVFPIETEPLDVLLD